MSRANELFARILKRGADEIRDMIATPVIEELFLDYKQAATKLPARALHEDDRKNLAKAISGFGNADGGIIVWGVDCRHGPDGDVPGPAIPIVDPPAFAALIENAAGGLTLPGYRGIRNWYGQDSTLTAGGFVVTLIEAGADVPIQSLYPKPARYYMRVGSSFGEVPHAVLAGMFGRRPQSIVTCTPNIRPMMNPNGNFGQIAIDIEVVNSGRTIADDVYLSVERNDVGGLTVSKLSHNNLWDDFADAPNKWSAIMKRNGPKLPPGSHILVFTIIINFQPVVNSNLTITFITGATDAAASLKQVVINPDDFSHLWRLLIYPHPENVGNIPITTARRLCETFIKSEFSGPVTSATGPDMMAQIEN